MACEDTNTPVARLIKHAFNLSGGTENGTFSNEGYLEEGLYYLNLILAQWSDNKKIFYDTEFKFLATGAQTEYIIQQEESTDPQVIQGMPFYNIFQANYRIGSIDYTVRPIQRAPYEGIPFKGITSYSDSFYYRNEQDKTILKFYPWPIANSLVTLFGTQLLQSVSLFEANPPIPSWAILPLTYELANNFVNAKQSTPVQGFYPELDNQRNQIEDRVERNMDYEMDTPLTPLNTIIGWGSRYYGGR